MVPVRSEVSKKSCTNTEGPLRVNAVINTNSSPLTGLGWKADGQPGRMSAFTVTGHSEALKRADLHGR